MALPPETPPNIVLPPASGVEASERVEPSHRWIWKGHVGPAFWTVVSVISLVVNLILIAALIGLGRQVFMLKNTVADPLINGLHSNFVKMDNARITTRVVVSDTIQVVDTIPVVFDLPLNTKTTVILVEDTPIDNVTIFLNDTAVPLRLILPQGTPLKIKLNLTVPVNQNIPVRLNVPVRLTVPVDIPLNQTELHEPFVGLRQVVEPYQTLLADLPASWRELPACGRLTGWLCKWFFE